VFRKSSTPLDGPRLCGLVVGAMSGSEKTNQAKADVLGRGRKEVSKKKEG